MDQWKKAVKKTNGTLKIEFVNGRSPKSYAYNLDYMVITQWDTKADFDAFQKANPKMNADLLKNVNQFRLSD